MMRHEPTPVQIRMKAPMRMARVEVSPIEPGMNPKNQSSGVVPMLQSMDWALLERAAAASERGVAPEYPSMVWRPFFRPATHTSLPEMEVG